MCPGRGILDSGTTMLKPLIFVWSAARTEPGKRYAPRANATTTTRETARERFILTLSSKRGLCFEFQTDRNCTPAQPASRRPITRSPTEYLPQLCKLFLRHTPPPHPQDSPNGLESGIPSCTPRMYVQKENAVWTCQRPESLHT